jgi:hypothetical protein
MDSNPRADAGRSASAPAGGLDEADRILLLATTAWSDPARSRADDGEAPGRGGRLWHRLVPSRSRRLREAWEGVRAAAGALDQAAARDQLGRAHRSEARVDPGRVHPSWWVRALQEESPSVRRVVAASAPEPVRQAVQAGLLLDSQDLVGDRAADPDALAWVLSLWAERLVGGEPERPDDPPAIRALSRLSPRAGYRLCRGAGLVKLALAGGVGSDEDSTARDGPRAEWLADPGEAADPEFQALAERDVRSLPTTRLPERRRAARLGLLTIARLLADCEPFRVRWALQHWPYAIAKLTRSLMPPASKRSPAASRGESWVLKTAWDRLFGTESLFRTGERGTSAPCPLGLRTGG